MNSQISQKQGQQQRWLNLAAGSRQQQFLQTREHILFVQTREDQTRRQHERPNHVHRAGGRSTREDRKAAPNCAPHRCFCLLFSDFLSEKERASFELQTTTATTASRLRCPSSAISELAPARHQPAMARKQTPSLASLTVLALLLPPESVAFMLPSTLDVLPSWSSPLRGQSSSSSRR